MKFELFWKKLATNEHELSQISQTQINADLRRFSASLVFLAGFACKVNFAANTCLRPQGHKNGLFISWRKRCFFRHENAKKRQKNEKKVL